MPVRHIGEIRTELIFSYTPPNTTGALIVPVEMQHRLDQELRRLGHAGLDRRFTARHPATGEQTVAIMPVPPGRVRMLQECGIVHGERFLATYEVYEKLYRGQPRREATLVAVSRLGQSVS